MLKRTLLIAGIAAGATIGATQTFAPVWSRLTDSAGNYNVSDVRVASRNGGGVFAAITKQPTGGAFSSYAMAYTRAGTVAWRSSESLPGYAIDIATAGTSMLMVVVNGASTRLVRISAMGTLEWSVPVDLGFEPSVVEVEASPSGIAVLGLSSDFSNSRLITFQTNGGQRWRSGNLPGKFRLKVEGDLAYVGGQVGAEPTSRLVVDRFSMGGGAPTSYSDGLAGYAFSDFVVDQGSVLAIGSHQAGTQGIRFFKLSPSMSYVHGSVFSNPTYPGLSPARIVMDLGGRILVTANQGGSIPTMVMMRGSFFDDLLQVASTRPSSEAENFWYSDLKIAADGSVFQAGMRDSVGGAVPVVRRFNAGGGFMGERTIQNGWLNHSLLTDNLGDIYSGGAYANATGFAPVVSRFTTAPIATNKAYFLAQNTELNVSETIQGLAAGQEGTVSILSSPSRGTLAFQPNGTFRYVPGRNFVGVDQFDYQIERVGMTARGTARITTECRVATIEAPERLAAGLNGIRAVIRLTGPAAPGDVNVQLHYSPEISGPLSVTIPRGVAMATIELSTSMVDTMKNAYMQASYGQNFVQRNIQVRPGQFSNFGVIQETFSGNEVIGEVQLDGLNDNPVSVHIQSSNPSALYIPGPVVVPARGMSQGFAFRSSNVLTDTPVTLTASANGVQRTATTRVCAPRMSDFTLDQVSIQGGQNGSAVVKIFGMAGPSGLQVSLRDNSTFVNMPMTVTIPAGETSVELPIQSQRVTSLIRVTLTAQIGTQMAHRILEVRP